MEILRPDELISVGSTPLWFGDVFMSVRPIIREGPAHGLVRGNTAGNRAKVDSTNTPISRSGNDKRYGTGSASNATKATASFPFTTTAEVSAEASVASAGAVLPLPVPTSTLRPPTGTLNLATVPPSTHMSSPAGQRQPPDIVAEI